LKKIGAEPDEIIFTSCGTESDNTAVMSAVESFPQKRHIITTRVEHPAVLNFCKHLARKGYRITFLSVNNGGQLNIDELFTALDDDTVLVTIMYANNEVGNIYPVSDIGSLLRERRVLFHTDAVQVAGKIAIICVKKGDQLALRMLNGDVANPFNPDIFLLNQNDPVRIAPKYFSGPVG
jgi:cysteine desulfurase